MKAKYIHESLQDFLKPKSEGELKDVFKKYGLGDDIIYLRIRKPMVSYVEEMFKRAVKAFHIKVEDYPEDRYVPPEESPKDFLKVSGTPWNMFLFFKYYYGFTDAPYNDESSIIDKMKRVMIKEYK